MAPTRQDSNGHAEKLASAEANAEAHICHLCRRKFRTAEVKRRHEMHSQLHAANLHKQDELVQQHKQEVLVGVHALRQQLHEFAAGRKRPAGPAEGQQAVENKLRQLLGEYGQAQEMLEHSIRSRGLGFAPTAPHRAVHAPLRCEARVGRLVLQAGAASWVSGKDLQEDRYILGLELRSSDGHPVVGFAVMDGHSGSLCVDYAAEHLQPALQARLSTKPSLTDEHLRQSVAEACAEIDQEFLARARQAGHMDGSTLVLALVYPEIYSELRPASDNRPEGSCRILVSNIGDSRAVLCRHVNANGTAASKAGKAGRLSAVRMSEDHKPDRPDELKRIQSKGGVVDMSGVWRVFTPRPVSLVGRTIPRCGLAVSRSLGDLLLKEPERHGCETQVQPGGLVIAEPEHRTVDLDPVADRFLVLACDGVWDVLRDEDAVIVCAGQAGAELAAHTLVRHAFAAGSADNLTAVVVSWHAAD